MCLLVMIGESCSVEKELESTRAANAVYQDKTNILFSVRTLLFKFENRQKWLEIEDVLILYLVLFEMKNTSYWCTKVAMKNVKKTPSGS